MIDPRALLPHESYCPRCGGEGSVPSEDAYVSSFAIEPRYLGMVPCPADCASGVVAVESRDATRPRGEIAAEFTRLRNDVAYYYRLAIHQADQIDALLAENSRFRESIDKAARVIVTRAQFQAGQP